MIKHIVMWNLAGDTLERNRQACLLLKERFEGLAPEPRAGITTGHIPSAVNLPYDRLLTGDGRWKQSEALADAFAGAQVDMGRPLITSCGSGGIACNLLFGAALLGKQDVTVYDGSWAEWGTDPETPKETGKTTGSA